MRSGIAAVLALWLPLCAAAPNDFLLQRIERPDHPPGRVAPQHSYIFGGPAYWPQALHWHYNSAGAPGQFAGDDAAMVQLFADAAAKWTAVCGVNIVYDGPSSSLPATVVNGEPDGVNVIGWQPPDFGLQAATSAWPDRAPDGDRILVDADIMLNPALVTTPEILASVITHEWGHAIGLGHSPVAFALMSGPPDGAYSNLTDPAPDDVQGCRCLYGLPANMQEGYICSLPSKIDFGTATVGTQSPARELDVTNDGTAPMTIGSLQLQSGSFVLTNNSCTVRLALAPGESCAIGIAGAPTAPSVQRTEAILDTSSGRYRIPLSVTGTPAPPPPLNFEGAWWNAPAGSEDGWGLTLAHQDDVIFTTWFTYDGSRRATWLYMTAFGIGNNTFTGTLYRSTGPPLTQDPFDPGAVRRAEVGTATLSFSDANRGVFSYTLNGSPGRKSIVRFAFGPLPTCTFAGPDDLARQNKFHGNWWTASGAESGWGLYLAHQGDTIFVGWFIYDQDGNPTWLSATANHVSNGVYRGDVIRSAGPPFDAASFDSQSVSRSTIGTMTLTFLDESHASFEYSVQIGEPPSTVSRTKPVEPLIFRPPGTLCEQRGPRDGSTQ